METAMAQKTNRKMLALCENRLVSQAIAKSAVRNGKRNGIKEAINLNTSYKVFEEAPVLKVIHAGTKTAYSPENNQSHGGKTE